MIASSKSLRTEFLRKAIHLSSLWMPLFIYYADRRLNIVCFAVLLLGNLITEYAAFRKVPFLGSLFRRMFIRTLRHREVSAARFVPSGSLYILTAALICSAFFPKPAAAAAMSIMLISDSCAALCGKLYGRIRFKNGKSAEGTLAFAVSAFAVVVMLGEILPVSPAAAAVTVIAATAAEFFEQKIRIDDNLTIPLISGFILSVCAF